ncbi:DUF2141 domain-containing protein [Paracraurococcus ruber]|uniref:DUF2141 domain-containing protein n=1 Tax=Paracraurococcus ruber TaxID=77675 RepID=A0ABS1CRR6_9PROT|nr:DUF2141 domain-containing protein [Paracraurococcus ruber]MBK1657085.1 hypothetical protein [Paracraurococcus ruber]TDG33384.1 DUF2141 domain-containing protein [Paracraurococcus ruber]
MRIRDCLPALLLLLPRLALAGDLLVTVQGVASDEGIIRVAACPPEDYPAGTCQTIARAPARAGRVQLRISGLPAGRWGVSAYHDADGDGRLGRDWLGRPTEGIGFGNDAPVSRFGPPGWEAAAVAVAAGGETRTAVTLRYR